MPSAPLPALLVTDTDRLKLERLDGARWLAALAVVMLHCAAQSLNLTAVYGSSAWQAANLYDSAARWCVPVFVMVSGALLLDPRRQQDLRTFYVKRLARILAPLVFWSCFYLLWRAYLDWLDDGRVDISAWGRNVAQGHPYYHLWYLYMIVGLYLFAPFVRTLYARTSELRRTFAVAVILTIAILDAIYRQFTGAGPGLFLTWCLPYLGYFIAGRMIFEGSLRVPVPWILLVGSVLATAAGVETLSSDRALNVYFYDSFSLTVPLMSLAVFELIVGSRRLPRLAFLAPLTFGVYLIHPVFLDIASRLGLYTGSAYDAWRMPAIAAAVFLLSAGVSWLMRCHPLTRKLV